MVLDFLLILAAYIIGSVNFAILLFKIFGKDDPRRHFSGNAGATNVYRQAGLVWAIFVLSLDIGRAVSIALAAVYLQNISYIPWVGFALILGNRFPCFHGFKGGKGVANYLGFTAVITLTATALSALAWVIGYGIFRKPFIASFFMVSGLAAGTIIKYQISPVAISGAAATAFLIFINHKKNMMELIEQFSCDQVISQKKR